MEDRAYGAGKGWIDDGWSKDRSFVLSWWRGEVNEGACEKFLLVLLAVSTGEGG